MTEERKKQLREAQARWREKNPNYYKKWLKKRIKTHGCGSMSELTRSQAYYRAHREQYAEYARKPERKAQMKVYAKIYRETHKAYFKAYREEYKKL